MDTDKYIYQKKDIDSYQCAPYAIYNLLQNSRLELNLTSLIRKCKAQKDIGTLVSDFNKTIINVNKVLKCDIRQMNETEIFTKMIKSILNNDGTIIILFHWHNGAALKGNHYALIDIVYNNTTTTKFRVINYSFDKPVHIITERELKSMLLPYSDEHFNLPVVWHN
jgi:hypothetical protein